MRCDRRDPCSSCLRRGKPEECTYSSSELERKDAVDYRPHVRGQQARERVARLEKLVTQMKDQMRVMEQSSFSPAAAADGSASSPGPIPDSDSQIASDAVGKLTLTDDHAVYIGTTHWVTVLEEVSGNSLLSTDNIFQ